MPIEIMKHFLKVRNNEYLIARALMAEPPLLILDEPTYGLDFIAREKLLKSIEEIAKSQNAPTMIASVTHHIKKFYQYSTKHYCLKMAKFLLLGKQ